MARIMRIFFTNLILILILGLDRPALAQKAELDLSLRRRSESSWTMARSIWEFAEVGYKETRSSALLADALKAEGFDVKRGVAGIPTAFTATIGSGKPVIAILGEYDALPE